MLFISYEKFCLHYALILWPIFFLVTGTKGKQIHLRVWEQVLHGRRWGKETTFSAWAIIMTVHSCWRYCRSQWQRSLRAFVFWDLEFESRQEHERLSSRIIVCYRVSVSGLGWSLLLSSPTECGVSEYDREASIVGRPRATRGWMLRDGKKMLWKYCNFERSASGSQMNNEVPYSLIKY